MKKPPEGIINPDDIGSVPIQDGVYVPDEVELLPLGFNHYQIASQSGIYMKDVKLVPIEGEIDE